MRIGEILVDGDRLFETCDRIGVPVERLQRAAAIGPGARMPGRGRDRRIERRERRLRPLEFEQRCATVVQRLDMMRGSRKRAHRNRRVHRRDDLAARAQCRD